jgi:arylsulfatase A-like enzyme
VLKSAGYDTAQFGKSHLGDRNEFLPTVHGFDEWFGNLHHLNAEEEPEQLDYPGQENPQYLKDVGPRGVLHTWATGVDDSTTDPKFGRVGKQRIENTGPLTRKRMETFDAGVLKYARHRAHGACAPTPRGTVLISAAMITHDRPVRRRGAQGCVRPFARARGPRCWPLACCC